MPAITLKAVALSKLPLDSVGVITENADVQLNGELPEGEAYLFVLTDTWSSLLPKDVTSIREQLRKLPAHRRRAMLAVVNDMLSR